MTPELIDLVLRFAAMGILGLFTLLLLRDRGREMEAWLGVAVLICTGCFVITSSNPFWRDDDFDLVLRQVAAFTPALLWMMTLRLSGLGRDWYIIPAMIVLIGLGVERVVLDLDAATHNLLSILHGLTALAMMGHGLSATVASHRGSSTTRIPLAVSTAAFGAVIAYVDPISHAFDLSLATELLASTATFLFSLSVALCTLAFLTPRAVTATHSAMHVIAAEDETSLPLLDGLKSDASDEPEANERRLAAG